MAQQAAMRAAAAIADIAERILGKPNAKLSSRDELRFGSNGSVAVQIAGEQRGSWYDHENQVGGGPRELLTLKGGVPLEETDEWFRNNLGIVTDAPAIKRRQVATFDYCDEAGALIFQVVRLEPKNFRQRQPDGTGGWKWKVKGVRQVPYRLPQLLAASPEQIVFIPEGEMKVERLEGLGQLATCNAGGAGKWKAGFAQYFAGKRVVILPDNDRAGRDHAAMVAANLVPTAASVKMLVLPGLAEKGDIINWLDQGSTIAELYRLADVAPLFQPKSDSEAASPKGLETSAPFDGKGPSQRDKLVSVSDGTELWRCPDGIAYATVPVNGHREHYRVRSREFRDWLLVEAGRAFPMQIAGRLRPSTFGKNAIEDALSACEATAAANGNVFPAPLRVAEHNDAFYLDLGRPNWEVVEITANGWRIIPNSPVPILRTRRMHSLPIPERGGSLEQLRGLLPRVSDDEWRLMVLWLLAALRPKGPYPINALSGEQGTGKSVVARMLRRLVDPCGDNIMQPPRDDRDLIAAAKGNHVLAFDNLSTMPRELADSLCRLATGGDIGGRLLYTNDETAAFAAQRPIIINGIPDLVSRGDLSSRAIFIRLMPMHIRRTEAELWQAFDAAVPAILGSLLDALSGVLRELPNTRLPEDSAVFRLADFALMAAAAERGLGWPKGSALDALRRNMRGASAMMADLDPVALEIRGIIERQGNFDGLVSALYARLNEAAGPDTRRAPGWPKHAARLGEHLRRIAPALRAIGLAIEERRTTAGMTVRITTDVGGLNSLSLLYEEELDSRPDDEGGRRVNTGSPALTSPTSSLENEGSPSFLRARANVGDVRDAGATYIRKSLESSAHPTADVGDVGETVAESSDGAGILPGARVVI
jgi:hypothetical protein